MKQEFFDKVANEAQSAYRLYIGALTAQLAKIMDQPNADTPAARKRFEDAAVRITADASASISAIVETGSAKAVSEALTDANTSALSEPQKLQFDALTSEARNATIMLLKRVMQRDADTVAEELRRFALEVAALTGQGVGHTTAVIRARYTRVSNLRFIHADRADRKWVSHNYVRTVVRAHLVNIYVESYLYLSAAAGRDLIKVVHQPGHKHDGVVFSITNQDSRYPSFAAIRAEIFHPNSNALVTQHEQV